MEGVKCFSFSIVVMVGNKGKDSWVKFNGGLMFKMGKILLDGKGLYIDFISKFYEYLEVKFSEIGYCCEGYIEIDIY